MPKARTAKRQKSTKKASLAQQPFRLLDLPLEVRLLIYEFYAEDEKGVYLVENQSMAHCAAERGCTHVKHRSSYVVSLDMGLRRFKSTYKVTNTKPNKSNFWALLWTNRTIRSEATAAIFGRAKFTFTSIFAIQPFLEDLNPSQRSSVHHIDIHLEESESIERKSSPTWSRTFTYLASLSLLTFHMSTHWAHIGMRPSDIVQLTDNDQLSWMASFAKIKDLDDFHFTIHVPDFMDFSFSDFPEEYSDTWSDTDEGPRPLDLPETTMEAIITCTLAKKVMKPQALRKKKTKEKDLWKFYHQTVKRRDAEDRMVKAGYKQGCDHLQVGFG